MSEEISNTNTEILENRQGASVKDLCFIAVFTAIICVLSQLSIPMPAGVPMTLQTLIVPLAGSVIGNVAFNGSKNGEVDPPPSMPFGAKDRNNSMD